MKAKKFSLPEGFAFPEMPDRLRDGLEEVISELVREYLPPEWSAVITDYVIMYSQRAGDTGNTLSDYAEWIGNLNTLQLFLAGARIDETGRFSEWVGPAPKLGVKASE